MRLTALFLTLFCVDYHHSSFTFFNYFLKYFSTHYFLFSLLFLAANFLLFKRETLPPPPLSVCSPVCCDSLLISVICLTWCSGKYLTPSLCLCWIIVVLVVPLSFFYLGVPDLVLLIKLLFVFFPLFFSLFSVLIC